MANQTPGSSNQSANRPSTDNKDALRQKDNAGRPSEKEGDTPAKRQER